MAYGDVAAAMNALPRAGETLNGAWTRQDLLYESDTEALSINPLTISKKDSEFRRAFRSSLAFTAVSLESGSTGVYSSNATMSIHCCCIQDFVNVWRENGRAIDFFYLFYLFAVVFDGCWGSFVPPHNIFQSPLALLAARLTATAKNPKWGRSRSIPAKKHEKSQVEKARSEEPLRRAPMLMSGSVDLRHSPERPNKAGMQQTKGRASVRGGCVVHSVKFKIVDYSCESPVVFDGHVDY